MSQQEARQEFSRARTLLARMSENIGWMGLYIERDATISADFAGKIKADADELARLAGTEGG